MLHPVLHSRPALFRRAALAAVGGALALTAVAGPASAAVTYQKIDMSAAGITEASELSSDGWVSGSFQGHPALTRVDNVASKKVLASFSGRARTANTKGLAVVVSDDYQTAKVWNTTTNTLKSVPKLPGQSGALVASNLQDDGSFLLQDLDIQIYNGPTFLVKPSGIGFSFSKLPASFDPSDMNSSRTVAGRVTSNGVIKAATWTEAFGIKSLGAPAGQSTEANAVNDNGFVVGITRDASGIVDGWLWNPLSQQRVSIDTALKLPATQDLNPQAIGNDLRVVGKVDKGGACASNPVVVASLKTSTVDATLSGASACGPIWDIDAAANVLQGATPATFVRNG